MIMMGRSGFKDQFFSLSPKWLCILWDDLVFGVSSVVYLVGIISLELCACSCGVCIWGRIAPCGW